MLLTRRLGCWRLLGPEIAWSWIAAALLRGRGVTGHQWAAAASTLAQAAAGIGPAVDLAFECPARSCRQGRPAASLRVGYAEP
jgi:hypothetical protein